MSFLTIKEKGYAWVLGIWRVINEEEIPYFSLKEVESKDFKVAKTILEKQI